MEMGKSARAGGDHSGALWCAQTLAASARQVMSRGQPAARGVSSPPTTGPGRSHPHFYFAVPTSGCVHAVSNSFATLPFTFAFEEMILART